MEPRDYSLVDFNTEKVRDIKGWQNDEKPYLAFPARPKISSAERHLIYRIAKELGAGAYADVGVYRGTSSAAIAHGVHDSGGRGTLYAVDFFGADQYSDPVTPDRLINYIEEKNLNIDLQICKGDSAEWGNAINEQLNFAFIDADHSYASVKKDFEAWGRLIKKGGIIGFHDIDFYGVDRTIKEMSNEWQLIRQIFRTKIFERL